MDEAENETEVETTTEEAVRPEWLPEKFESPEALAQSYTELEKQFSQARKKESPEEYSFDEKLADDPVVAYLTEVGKKTGMSQEEFDYALSQFDEIASVEAAKSKEQVAKQFETLGKDVGKRQKHMLDWGRANLGEDEFKAFDSLMGNPDAFRVIEQLVSKTRETPVPSGNVVTADGKSWADVQKMRYAKNEHGQFLCSIDPAYKKRVDELAASIAGTEPVNEVVG